MNHLSFLTSKGNNFSQSDIQKTSESLFDVFHIELEEEEALFQEKKEILQSYLEVLKKLLYSGLIEQKEKKLAFIKIINKLKSQKELLELLSSQDSKQEVIDLLATSERFGKKTQSSIEK